MFHKIEWSVTNVCTFLQDFHEDFHANDGLRLDYINRLRIYIISPTLHF